MKKTIYILVLVAFLTGCSKDNPMEGTSWLSTCSDNCWFENYYYDGDYSEVLTFSKSNVSSKTLKNGYTYKNNWSKPYVFEDNTVIIDGHDYWYYHETSLSNGRYVFYKQ